MKTTNGGINWFQINLIPNPNILYFTHIDNKFWVSAGNEIYCSYDNGNNFFLQHTRPYTEGYWQIDLKKTNNEIFGWAVTNHGTISKYHEFIGIKKISTEVPYKFMLYQNYPNPFNPGTKIKYDLKAAGEVKLVVYDIQGSETAVLVNQRQEIGTYEVEWNAADYPSGVYFYKLITDNFIDTKKMVLIK
jgi:hypothetical protein